VRLLGGRIPEKDELVVKLQVRRRLASLVVVAGCCWATGGDL
jgi:hypothetical protein